MTTHPQEKRAAPTLEGRLYERLSSREDTPHGCARALAATDHPHDVIATIIRMYQAGDIEKVPDTTRIRATPA